VRTARRVRQLRGAGSVGRQDHRTQNVFRDVSGLFDPANRASIIAEARLALSKDEHTLERRHLHQRQARPLGLNDMFPASAKVAATARDFRTSARRGTANALRADPIRTSRRRDSSKTGEGLICNKEVVVGQHPSSSRRRPAMGHGSAGGSGASSSWGACVIAQGKGVVTPPHGDRAQQKNLPAGGAQVAPSQTTVLRPGRSSPVIESAGMRRFLLHQS
jgi:hypothetical protein